MHLPIMEKRDIRILMNGCQIGSSEKKYVTLVDKKKILRLCFSVITDIAIMDPCNQSSFFNQSRILILKMGREVVVR